MFKIGEFSKLTQVPASALRYYDDIGLFKPAITNNENAYRFYTSNQIPVLNKIIALKELGLNLEQIQHILSEDLSPEVFKGMLKMKHAELEQKLAEDKARLLRVSARLSQLSLQDIKACEDIEIKTVPEVNYLNRTLSVSSFDEALISIRSLNHLIYEILPVKRIGKFIAILQQDCYEHTDLTIQIGFSIEMENDGIEKQFLEKNNLSFCQLPSCETMLSSIHFGPPNVSFTTRATIANWLEKSEYEIAGYGREVFLSNPTPGNMKDLVIEIQYPIKKQAPS